MDRPTAKGRGGRCDDLEETVMSNKCLRGTLPILAAACLLLCGAMLAQEAPSGHPNTKGWPDLLKADLSNAVMDPGSWVYENGTLTAKDRGTIWTKESYGNFILDLEFKVSPKANSGVFLRTSDMKNVLSGFEIQVHESTDGSKYGMVGALYDCKPPSKNVAKPAGEWNRYTITMRDSRLSLIFNGELVQDLDLNDWKEARKNPDGTPNKFAVALKDYARQGVIGIQGIHGREAQPVWYRNIKIKKLD
jgi:hypothetical protein